MKLITINPNNEPYYSEDFIKGFECGTQRQLEADIADMPTWIPCSERLPEEKKSVAVIIKQWDTGEIKKGITYRVDRNMWVGFGRHNKACVWWLPLPPWKGADDETE